MRVRRLLTWVALSAAAGCSGQQAGAPPLAPSPPAVAISQPANFAGTWRVTYHVDACIGRYCYISHINKDQQLDLRLLQIGDRVTGSFLSNGLVADVAGGVGADGALSLTGYAPSPGPVHGALELKRFEVTLDDATGLRGMLEYESRIPGEYSAYSTGATGPVVRAERAPLAIGSFSGTWRGFFNTTSCTPGPYCLLDNFSQIELALSERGGEISGELLTFSSFRVALSGTASGDTATLTGVGSGAGSGVAVSDPRFQRSASGRLSGRLTMTLPGTRGWQAEVELVGMALTPDP